MNYRIKDPTIRKVRRRGFTPVRWQTDAGWFNGWVYKRGRVWLHCYFPALGRKRVRLEEERWITEL